MAKKSAFLRSATVKAALGEGSFPSVTTAYLALFENDPELDGSGDEVSGGSYARQAISWGAESDGILQNDTAVSFTSLPSGFATHWAIFDASSGGNLLYFGPLALPINMSTTPNPQFEIGDITIGEE